MLLCDIFGKIFAHVGREREREELHTSRRDRVLEPIATVTLRLCAADQSTTTSRMHAHFSFARVKNNRVQLIAMIAARFIHIAGHGSTRARSTHVVDHQLHDDRESECKKKTTCFIYVLVVDPDRALALIA